MNAEISPSTVELAREADFRLGALEVRPSRREIVSADHRTLLEPRVMQALVALVRRRGEVVSRDELVAACWDRIVGDDAINACIAKVRRMGEVTGAYVVETIPRVGYRLASDAAGAAAADAAQEILLAVLAFENLSDDPQMSYFSDGVSEEVLHALAQRADLRVIGRASSFQLRGADKAPSNVARRLGATHVLDGAVRRAGEAVRVSAQLVECATQTTLWSERFEGDVRDVFALQDRVAAAAALAMQRSFEPLPPRGVDPVAYDLYLRGSAVPTESAVALLRPKMALLEQATVRAPAFADAWARLGFVRAHLAALLPPESASFLRDLARADAGRALQIAPRNVLAALALARAEPAHGAFAAVGGWIRKAVAWAPNDVFAKRMWALFVASIGQLRLSVRLLRECVKLDPLDYLSSNGLAAALTFSGEFEEADEVATETLRRWPEFPNSAASAAQIAAWRGDFQRARRIAAEHDLGVYGRSIAWFIDICAGDGAARGRSIGALRRQHRDRGSVSLDTMMFAAHLGFAEEALQIGEAAGLEPVALDDSRNAEVYYLPTLFMVSMPEARRSARFVSLCARLGLVDYWLAEDEWPDCVDEVAPWYDFKAECRRTAQARRPL